MNTKISALIDGEVDTSEIRELCIAMRKDPSLRSVYSTYMLIGDALRGESHLATELSGAVLDHLADEPVVLSPGASRLASPFGSQGLRPALAMAATISGIAVVVWLSFSNYAGQQQVAERSVKNAPIAVASAGGADMQEYLIAHQIQSGSLFLNSDAQRIRTVSMTGVESR